jgi:hypothetical protein
MPLVSTEVWKKLLQRPYWSGSIDGIQILGEEPYYFNAAQFVAFVAGISKNCDRIMGSYR